MISDVFFHKNIELKNEYLYEDFFLAYFVSKIINDTKSSSIDLIFQKLENFYGIHSFNYGKMKNYIEKKYIAIDNNYFLTKDQKLALKNVDEFKSTLYFTEVIPNDILYKNLSNCISIYNINNVTGFKFIAALLKKENLMSEEFLLAKYYDLIINYDTYYNIVDEIMLSIDVSYEKLPINYVFNNQVLIEILLTNGISNICDLKQLSADTQTLLFSVDFDNIITNLSPLCQEFELSYKDEIFNIFKALNSKELDILDRRNGFTSGKKMTLEEVGGVYGLTRERCRQIEDRATNKVIKASANVKSILINLYLVLCDRDSNYISAEKLYSYVGDNLLSRYILFVYEVAGFNITYDSRLKVVFDKNVTSLDEISDVVLEKFGDVIQITEYEKLDTFKKILIQHSYKLFRDCAYIKRGLSEKNIITNIIDDIFPNGYRINSIDDYEKLRETYYSLYSDSEEFPSSRSIIGYLDRMNYCLIDKGTYRNRSECIVLPQELIDKIINYILENAPTVFYSSIYETFETQLKELKVNNYYYLKGLIDSHLPTDFKTMRNYLTVGDKKISSTDAIINYMKSFDGIFGFDDIQEKFKGVKSYTIYNVMYSELESGLIFLSDKKFIYLSQINISQEIINKLKGIIDTLFSTLNTRVISARKVFARLSLINKELLSSLKIATDSFSTFSLIKCLFRNEYGFNRPLISLDKDSVIDSFGLIVNYVSTLDEFTSETIKIYTTKMNIRGLYSFLEFMEDQSDNFVQISQGKMVSKSKINISRNDLEQIEKTLGLIFSRFDEIDVDNFNGYFLLPKLPYRWNKYLLVGVIRSYFNDKYEIKNTTAFYDKTNFIIRRIK